MTTFRARIIVPIPYQAEQGNQHRIPVGPCLIESRADKSVDIIWGAQGQSCTALPVGEIKTARDVGHLVLLD